MFSIGFLRLSPIVGRWSPVRVPFIPRPSRMFESRAAGNVVPQSPAPQGPDPPAGYFTVIAPELAHSKNAGETSGTGQSRAVVFLVAIVLAATASVGALMITSGVDKSNVCNVTSCASTPNPLTLVSRQVQPGA